jgi:hypothetical protein
MSASSYHAAHGPGGRVLGALALLALAFPAAAASQTLPADPDRPTVRAVRVAGPIVLDGRLDEPAWRAAPVATGFRQVEPREGVAARFETEVRLLFDDRFLYVGAYMRDTVGMEGVRVPDLRRNWDYFQSDLFGISIDGIGDGRTAVAFQVNPRGALRDLRVFDGRFPDREWEGVWEARTEVTDTGWTAEVRIPWATLRYQRQLHGRGHPGSAAVAGGDRPEVGGGAEREGVAHGIGQAPDSLRLGGRAGLDRHADVGAGAVAWRVNFVRRVRRHDELSGWAPWPREDNPYTMGFAGWLIGLEPPPPARNLRVQPFATARAAREGAEGSLLGDAGVQVGGDAKWAITPSTVLDLTVNTDFAEADVDRSVVNLTRFSVFFPERRPFFQENAGLFQIGWGSIFEPFFSRRIGLDATGQPLPILGGARLVRQAPGWSGGAMAIREEGERELPGSTVAVGRFQRNVGAQNRIGALVTGRYDDVGGAAPRVMNTMLALDGLFRPTRTFTVRSLVSGSLDGGDVDRQGWSAYAQAANTSSWGYVGWVQGIISEEYNPALGFLPRRDLITTSPAIALDLRPTWLPRGVRSLRPGFTGYWYHAASTRDFQEGFLTVRPLNLQFDGAEELTLWVRRNWQVLDRPFRPIPGLALEPGRYAYDDVGVTWRPDLSRAYWAQVTVSAGEFFDGRTQQLVYRASPLPGPRVGLTFDYTGQRFQDVGTAEASVTSHLLGAELRMALNPRLQLVSFYQRNTSFATDTWNTRLSWEFQPLSFVHLVFNDGQQFGNPTFGVPTGPRRQQLILKASWLGQL